MRRIFKGRTEARKFAGDGGRRSARKFRRARRWRLTGVNLPNILRKKSSGIRISKLFAKKFKEIPTDEITIIATGPLTTEALTAEIMKFTGDDQLYFYDAIAPIVAADSIDMSIAFKAARYGKGGDDYINCPFDTRAICNFLQ